MLCVLWQMFEFLVKISEQIFSCYQSVQRHCSPIQKVVPHEEQPAALTEFALPVC